MILGVNGYGSEKIDSSHDASVGLFTLDGELIAAAEEERFTRNKHAEGAFPHNAIAYSLREARIAIGQITDLAIGWNYALKSGENLSDEDFLSAYLPRSHFGPHSHPKVHRIDHHVAHASSSYLLSGFDEANVIVIDGKGEQSATSLFVAFGKELKRLRSFPIKDSLGFLIEELGHYLGMGLFAAGKVMGLAAYGKNRIALSQVRLTPDGYYAFDIPDDRQPYYAWNKIYDKILNIPSEDKHIFDSTLNRFRKKQQMRLEDFSEKTLDLAFTVQKIIEDIVFRIAETLHKETGARKLCLSGGVALNCPTNTRLLDSGFVDDIYIFPAANDGGCSVGAAANVLANKYGIMPQKVTSPYTGPKFSDIEIKETLEKLKIDRAEQKSPEEIAKLCAEDLVAGKIVGWFQGRMEIGPRALGNRSILANPCIPGIVAIVNIIKGRELWRPLAISILDKAVSEYFQDYTWSSIAPYMLTTARSRHKSITDNVLHVDGTTRPQVLMPETCRHFYGMIEKFIKVGGVPFVINTSFNRFDEPIVCSPFDAIKTFYTMGLDSLYLGNFVLRK